MSLALNSAFWQTACYTVVLMTYNVGAALRCANVETKIIINSRTLAYRKTACYMQWRLQNLKNGKKKIHQMG